MFADHLYNHGVLSRAHAEALLNSLDYNCFLVRQSSNAVGCFVYSYKDYGHFNHVKKEGNIDLNFVHSTQESACLMPIHIKGMVLCLLEVTILIFFQIPDKVAAPDDQ